MAEKKYFDINAQQTFYDKLKTIFQSISNLVTSWSSTPSDTKYPSEKLVKDELDTKVNASDAVDVIAGDNVDIQQTENGVEISALKNLVTGWQTTPDDTHYPSEKLVKDSLDEYSNIGVRNLLSNAKNGAIVHFTSVLNTYSYDGASYTHDGTAEDSYIRLYFLESVDTGETVTFSCDISGLNEADNEYISFKLFELTPYKLYKIRKNGHASFTVTRTTTTTITPGSSVLTFDDQPQFASTAPSGFTISNIKLERGAASTSYSKHPAEDPKGVYFVNGSSSYSVYDATKTYTATTSSGPFTSENSCTYNNIAYYCNTTISTAEAWNSSHWTVISNPVLTGTIDGLISIYTGLKIAYRFTVRGGTSATYLNINNLGNKYIYRNNNNFTTHLPVNSIAFLCFDGNAWQWADYDADNYYTSIGVYCSTAAGTSAKVGTSPGHVNTAGEAFLIRIVSANTYAGKLTLNINNQGAKDVWINGSVSSSTNYTLPAGEHWCYYDGTVYHIWTNGTAQFKYLKAETFTGNVSGTASNAVGYTNVGGIATALDGKVPSGRKVNGKALSADITLNAADVSAIATSARAAANGVASLDANGKVPTGQLPALQSLTAGIDLKIANSIISVNTNGTVGNSADMPFVAGSGTYASGIGAAAFGVSTYAKEIGTHTEGNKTSALGWGSHAEGSGTIASGQFSHAEGFDTKANGNGSHAEGWSAQALAAASHSEGLLTRSIGEVSHAEGNGTSACGYASHSEGENNIASGNYSHTEGWETYAEGQASHAEGASTSAIGDRSHAGGYNTLVSGDSTFAHGDNNSANSKHSFVIGVQNKIGTINFSNNVSSNYLIGERNVVDGVSNNYTAFNYQNYLLGETNVVGTNSAIRNFVFGGGNSLYTDVTESIKGGYILGHGNKIYGGGNSFDYTIDSKDNIVVGIVNSAIGIQNGFVGGSGSLIEALEVNTAAMVGGEADVLPYSARAYNMPSFAYGLRVSAKGGAIAMGIGSFATIEQNKWTITDALHGYDDSYGVEWYGSNGNNYQPVGHNGGGVAIGSFVSAFNAGSFACGLSSLALAPASFVAGKGNTATHYGEAIVGKYANGYTTYSDNNALYNALFVVGDGASANTHNAFVVYEGGYIGNSYNNTIKVPNISATTLYGGVNPVNDNFDYNVTFYSTATHKHWYNTAFLYNTNTNTLKVPNVSGTTICGSDGVYGRFNVNTGNAADGWWPPVFVNESNSGLYSPSTANIAICPAQGKISAVNRPMGCDSDYMLNVYSDIMDTLILAGRNHIYLARPGVQVSAIVSWSALTSRPFETISFHRVGNASTGIGGYVYISGMPTGVSAYYSKSTYNGNGGSANYGNTTTALIGIGSTTAYYSNVSIAAWPNKKFLFYTYY